MKKISLGFLLFSLFSLCLAQHEVKYVDAKIDANVVEKANTDLAQIEISFCDKGEEKGILLTSIGGKNQDVCYTITNSSSRDIPLTVEFVDGSITNDQRKNKSCMQNGENKKFGQYVTGFASSFTVPANNELFHHATIHMPKNSSGVVNGCLVYYTKSVAMGGNINFALLMRKAKFIDVYIQKNEYGTYSIYLILLAIVVIIYFRRKHKK